MGKLSFRGKVSVLRLYHENNFQEKVGKPEGLCDYEDSGAIMDADVGNNGNLSKS